MTIVIETPVRSYSFGASSSPDVDQVDNRAFLTATLGNPKRLHYTSSSQLFVVSDCDDPRYGSPGVSLASRRSIRPSPPTRR